MPLRQIRTRSPSKRTTSDPCLRPCGHWERQTNTQLNNSDPRKRQLAPDFPKYKRSSGWGVSLFDTVTAATSSSGQATLWCQGNH